MITLLIMDGIMLTKILEEELLAEIRHLSVSGKNKKERKYAMKKQIALLLSITILLGVTACRDGVETKDTKVKKEAEMQEENTLLDFSELPKVSLGTEHTMMLDTNGNLYTWGSNVRKQLGVDGGSKSIPYKLMTDVAEISALYQTSMALTRNGDLYIWGQNNANQCGTGKPYDVHTPYLVMGDVVSYAGLAALTFSGDVYTWGLEKDSSEVTKILSNIATLKHNKNSYIAITKDNELYMWGKNPKWGNIPTYVISAEDIGYVKNPVKVMDGVKDAYMTSNTAAVITTENELYVWGSILLPAFPSAEASEPHKILENVVSTMIGMGEEGSQYVLAITSDAELYVYGRMKYLRDIDVELGYFEEPQKILDDVAEVCAGREYAMAVTSDGSLYTWGDNYCGELGNGTVESVEKPTKIMDHISKIYSIETGESSNISAAISEDGSLYTWGYANLGYDTGNPKKTCPNPTKILDNVESVEFESKFSAAVTKDGEVYLWGSNSKGEIGNGGDEIQITPWKLELNREN